MLSVTLSIVNLIRAKQENQCCLRQGHIYGYGFFAGYQFCTGPGPCKPA